MTGLAIFRLYFLNRNLAVDSFRAKKIYRCFLSGLLLFAKILAFLKINSLLVMRRPTL